MPRDVRGREREEELQLFVAVKALIVCARHKKFRVRADKLYYLVAWTLNPSSNRRSSNPWNQNQSQSRPALYFVTQESLANGGGRRDRRHDSVEEARTLHDHIQPGPRHDR
jgi:hypothetical protein